MSNTIVPLVPLVWSGSLASTSQPAVLPYKDSQTWLRDSVCQVPALVQWHLLYLSGRQKRLLHAEIVVLLVKDAMRPVPPGEMKMGLQPLVHRTEGGVLQPILGLRVWNWTLHRLAFNMLRQLRIFHMHLPARLVCGNRPEGTDMHTFMSRFYLTYRFFGLLLNVRHISTRSLLLGCPCLLSSSQKSQGLP